MKSHLSALIIALYVLTASGVPRAQAVPDVPSGLVAASRLPPMSFAMSLVDNFVPTGIEVRGSPIGPREPMPAFDLDRQNVVPVTDVIQGFNTAHSDYRATWTDNVILIRPIERRLRFLDSAAGFVTMTVQDPLLALARVFEPIEPRLGGRTRAGSSMASRTERGADITVTLVGAGQSVVQVLNQLATQSDRGWVVYTMVPEAGPPQINAIGLIHRHGATTYFNLPQ
jgi:hypothetical protein